jgi:hypothetical protein
MGWNTEIGLLERARVILVVIRFTLNPTVAHLKDGLGNFQRIISLRTTKVLLNKLH